MKLIKIKNINSLTNPLLYIFFFIFLKVYSYTVDCDYMGKCSFIVGNNSYDILNGNNPLYKEISKDEIDYKLNDTYYLLKLEKQIDGLSNYGLLKGTQNGYECSGGLWECKDSCCLDGFCVEILFFCDKENEFVTFISLLLGIFFGTLIVLYWSTYCFLGFKFKDDLTKTMKEEKELYYVDFSRKNENSENNKNIRDSAYNASVTDNYMSQVPIVDSIIRDKNNALKN